MYYLHLQLFHLTPPAPNHNCTSSSLSSSSTPYFHYLSSIPIHPIYGVFLIGGLLPFFLTYPWTRTVGVFVLQVLIIQGLPIAWKRMQELKWKVQSFYRDFPLKLWFAKTRRGERKKRYTQVFEKAFLTSIPYYKLKHSFNRL